MRDKLINAVLENPGPEAITALLENKDTVFWVDWRAEDDSIAQSCENVLRTGELSGELVEVDTADGYEVFVRYRDRRIRVPLTYSAADRHLTLCALNQVLHPDYEIRFCIDSSGNDTLGFLPLPARSWTELEQRYGPTVARIFYRIASSPNLFTESLHFPQKNQTSRRAQTPPPSRIVTPAAPRTGAENVGGADRIVRREARANERKKPTPRAIAIIVAVVLAGIGAYLFREFRKNGGLTEIDAYAPISAVVLAALLVRRWSKAR